MGLKRLQDIDNATSVKRTDSVVGIFGGKLSKASAGDIAKFGELENNSIITSKLADGAVTKDKLAFDTIEYTALDLSGNTVKITDLADGVYRVSADGNLYNSSGSNYFELHTNDVVYKGNEYVSVYAADQTNLADLENWDNVYYPTWKEVLDELDKKQDALKFTGNVTVDTRTKVVNADVPENLSELNDDVGYRKAVQKETLTDSQSVTLADNTEYTGTGISALAITYPAGEFEVYLSITFADSGAISVFLPDSTKYIGEIPAFNHGETWELSIKNGVLVGGKIL